MSGARSMAPRGVTLLVTALLGACSEPLAPTGDEAISALEPRGVAR